MITFNRPLTQDRLHAALYELIRMRFTGTVIIEGGWDAYDALEYLENRLRVEIIPTMRMDGSLFYLNDKYVRFLIDHVVITTFTSDAIESNLSFP